MSTLKTNRVNTAQWVESQQRWQIKVQKDGERKMFVSRKRGRIGQREANAKADAWLNSGTIAPTIRLKVKTAVEDYKKYLAEIECTKKGIHYNPANITGRMLGSSRNVINHLEVWFVPKFGNRYLDTINDGDVQRVLDLAAASGLSLKTLKNIRGSITAFIKYHRRRGQTDYRPDDISIPSYARLKGKEILQPDDLIVLMTSDMTILNGERVRDEYINAYRLQVLLGLRPGELIGLQWPDVDLQKNVIHLRRSVNIYGDETNGKNANAIRDIYLHSRARSVLLQQKLFPTGTPYVFPIRSEYTYRERLIRYCESNNITVVTPYGLRHTFVSLCRALPEGQLKAIVGHSENMDTFGIYGHDVEGQIQQVSQNLNTIFDDILEVKKKSGYQSGYPK